MQVNFQAFTGYLEPDLGISKRRSIQIHTLIQKATLREMKRVGETGKVISVISTRIHSDVLSKLDGTPEEIFYAGVIINFLVDRIIKEVSPPSPLVEILKLIDLMKNGGETDHRVVDEDGIMNSATPITESMSTELIEKINSCNGNEAALRALIEKEIEDLKNTHR